MKFDLTVGFSKTHCTTFKLVNGKPTVKEEYLLPYVLLIQNNLIDRKEYEFPDEANHIPELIFRSLARDENTLEIDESFYEKSLVGWYTLDKDMREFFTPIKVENLCEIMFNHMKDYTNNKGDLMLYFELV